MKPKSHMHHVIFENIFLSILFLVNLISNFGLLADYSCMHACVIVNNKIMSALASSSIVVFPGYNAVDSIRPPLNILTDRPVKKCQFSVCDYLCLILLALSVTSILVVPTVFLLLPAAPYQVMSNSNDRPACMCVTCTDVDV